MAHVFISYSRHDTEYVVRLSEHLKKLGIDVFYDGDINYSSRWWTTIVQHVKACAAMIVVMTPALDSSEWATMEVLLARQYRKPIFPLLLEGDGYPLLIDLQRLDVTSGELPGQDFIAVVGSTLSFGMNETRWRTALSRVPAHEPAASRSMSLNVDALAARVARARDTLEHWHTSDEWTARTPAMLMTKAYALEDLLEIDECLATCNQALTIDRGNIPATIMKTRCLSELCYYSEFADLIDEVLARQPDQVDALVLRAESMRRQEIGGSESIVDRALALDPRHVGALVAKAQYLDARGDRSAADRLIHHAAALEPGSTDVSLALMDRDKDPQECLYAAEVLARIFPRSPLVRTLVNIARLDVVVNSEEAAEVRSRKLSAIGHESIAAGLRLDAPVGRFISSIGHAALALAHLTSGDTARADAELTEAETLCDERERRFRRAIDNFRRAVDAKAFTLGLQDLVSRFGADADFHAAPAIPSEKLTNARTAGLFDGDDVVLALVDCSHRGAPENCIVFTDTFAAQFHSRFAGDHRTKMPYSALARASYQVCNDDVLDPSTGLIWFTTDGSGFGARRVAVLLDAIKTQVANAA